MLRPGVTLIPKQYKEMKGKDNHKAIIFMNIDT